MKHTAVEDSLIVHSMLKQGNYVLFFDVPGIGSLGPGYLKGDAFIDNIYLKIVFTQNGVEDNFKHSDLEEGRLVNEQIIEWLR